MNAAIFTPGLLLLPFAYWLKRVHDRRELLQQPPRITELWTQHLEKETRLLLEALLTRYEQDGKRQANLDAWLNQFLMQPDRYP